MGAIVQSESRKQRHPSSILLYKHTYNILPRSVPGRSTRSGEYSRRRGGSGVFSYLSPRGPVYFPAPQAGLMPSKGWLCDRGELHRSLRANVTYENNILILPEQTSQVQGRKEGGKERGLPPRSILPSLQKAWK